MNSQFDFDSFETFLDPWLRSFETNFLVCEFKNNSFDLILGTNVDLTPPRRVAEMSLGPTQ